MVLGIVAALMAVIPGLSFAAWLFAVPAIILGIIGLRKRGLPHGRALAGLIEGGAALVVAIAVSSAAAGSVSEGFSDGVDSARATTAAETTASPSATSKPTAAPAKPTADAAKPTKEAAPAADTSEYGTGPADEVAFVQAIQATADSLGGDLTDLQRSQALRNRDAALCSTLGDATATDWSGKITTIGANGEGKAYVTVEIAPGVEIKTWNNAFSDAVDNTLIDPSTPFFNNLVAMKEGQKVTFTAQMVAEDGSCLSKGNLTETFYGISPQFIAHFTNVVAQ
ncbi:MULTISPECIES: DUF4190 domain-containing protein [unclassified Curtobacterium]|uniref:DUF4190 domain-containing protein n=1 Tax=unclassified Curtobacterium TaxID=257496 RepID=UPI000F471A8A|nr:MULTISPECIES: DUF4190 domain-containing protein [unclassified Curtobacterium]